MLNRQSGVVVSERSSSVERPTLLHVVVPDSLGRAYITQGHDGQWRLPQVWHYDGEPRNGAAIRAVKEHLGLELPVERFAWLGNVSLGPVRGDAMVACPPLTPLEAIGVVGISQTVNNFALLEPPSLAGQLHDELDGRDLLEAFLRRALEVADHHYPY